jgi:hypothetical protein
MDGDFEMVWDQIQKNITPGMVIKNWGKARGYTGNSFSIHSISELKIICKPPKAKNFQLVPKRDFFMVWEFWEDYKEGSVQRKFFRDKVSRFSSYIISIFHFLDY